MMKASLLRLGLGFAIVSGTATTAVMLKSCDAGTQSKNERSSSVNETDPKESDDDDNDDLVKPGDTLQPTRTLTVSLAAYEDTDVSSFRVYLLSADGKSKTFIKEIEVDQAFDFSKAKFVISVDPDDLMDGTTTLSCVMVQALRKGVVSEDSASKCFSEEG